MRGKKPKERQRYVLRVNETLVEVTRDVYLAWYQSRRKERYQLEKMQKTLKNLSNEFMNNEVSINEEKLYGLEEQYKAMVSAIIKMLDAAQYLWNPDKEKSPK